MTEEDPYLQETLLLMRDRESKLPEYRNRSNQLENRRFFIDWICLAGTEKFDLPRSANHLAVLIFDRFMDGHWINDSETVHFVCLACLSIAAKFDCKETQVPKFRKLKTLLDNPEHLKAKEFRRLEKLILAHFKWNIYIPTPTHYVDLLHWHVLDSNDLMDGTSISLVYSEEVEKKLMEFIHYFLDISMQETLLAGMEPCKVAASAIYCARAVLNLSPVWPLNLQRLLGGLPIAAFEHCNTLLLHCYVQSDAQVSSNFALQDLATQQKDSPEPPRKKAKKGQQLFEEGGGGGETPSVIDEGYVSRTSFVVEETPPTN